MEKINLTLTFEEVKTVMESLVKLPYIEVNSLINKIQDQTRLQLTGSNDIDEDKVRINGQK